MPKIILAADQFCGAGGTSLGFTRACYKRGLTPDLLAINHWPLAIETHSENLAYARHMCMSLDQVNPREAVPGGRLHLLMSSPECTHHSVARGGKPINDQSRATAWHVIKWAQELWIANILVENVPEFQSWGPLKSDLTPDKRYKGQLFMSWIENLRALNYNVEWRELCAADYGDATTRVRLFVQAKKKHLGPVTWPEPTHARPLEVGADLFSAAKKPWRSAREIIDWDITGRSIFNRKKPLSPNTIKRIAAGLKKFGGAAAEPFLVMLYGTGMVRDVDRPLPTVTADGQHIALCEPFVVNLKKGSMPRSVDEPCATQTTKQHQYLCEPFVLGQQSCSAPRSTDLPIPTVATAGAIRVCEPFLIPQFSEHAPRSIDRPIGTVTTTSRGVGLVDFVIGIDHQGGDGSPRSVEEPITTMTTKARHCVVEAVAEPVSQFLVHSGGPSVAERSVDQPLNTILTREHMAVVEAVALKVDASAFLVNVGGPEGSGRQPKSVDVPLNTVLTENHTAVVEPFIMAVNHGCDGPTSDTRRCYSMDDPLRTLTTEKSFAVVDPFLMAVNHAETGNGSARCYTVDDPLGTLTTKGSFAVIDADAQKVDQAFLVKYYGSGIATSVDEPLDTVTTKDRFGLVTINGEQYVLDIRLRMLEPKELAAAHSMEGHIFKGPRSMQVKQIGNGVPSGLSEALTGNVLDQYADVSDETDVPVDLLIAGTTETIPATV